MTINTPPEKKRPMIKTVSIVLIAALLIAALAIGLVMVFNSDTKKTPQKTPDNPEDILIQYLTHKEAPDEKWNKTTIGYCANHDILLRGNLVYSSSGVTTDQREWTKYYFEDEETYLIYMQGENNTEGDLYMMFAKTNNACLGGQYDEVYRKVAIKKDSFGYWLDTSKGNIANIADNALHSTFGYVYKESEAFPKNFLYWDASEKNVLTTTEWKNNLHFEERSALNDDASLPKSAAEAVKKGFIKLPVEDTKYHQLYEDKYKNWYEIFESEFQEYACLKYCHPNGREAIYLIVKANQTQESIESDPDATQLIPLNGKPDIGPTFNFSPNDFSSDFFQNLSSKTTANSVAHYYFDMLPYYWWGNIPDPKEQAA